ncbi:transposase [Paenibacillus sp. ACRRX]|uniref:transposase n=1 Tax=Paenibacillus sp. ACRRX TaxID=2918206 RepID=UPI001EF4F25E|nr:transposase [Paenibacillus sp. ACRRX]MCG7406806.1 transposase [Paenibacillus sp. ACRRX]
MEEYALAIQRLIEPEPVFGDIKNNLGFKRFLLRDLPKVNLEVEWLSLSHNLRKSSHRRKKQRS